MTAPTPLSALLRRHGACPEAVEWAKPYTTLQAAWDVCQRPDWMLWLLVKMHSHHGAAVHATVDCAETALPIYERCYPNENRVRECLAVTRRWADGKATIGELREARAAARAAPAYAAAAAAAYAYADAASAASAYAASAYAAADAAAADADAADAARLEAMSKMAALIRKRIPNPEVIS